MARSKIDRSASIPAPIMPTPAAPAGDAEASELPALVDPTPVLRSTKPWEKAPKTAPAKRYRVMKAGSFYANGWGSTVYEGAIVDERSHDVDAMIRQGFALKEIE